MASHLRRRHVRITHDSVHLLPVSIIEQPSLRKKPHHVNLIRTRYTARRAWRDIVPRSTISGRALRIALSRTLALLHKLLLEDGVDVDLVELLQIHCIEMLELLTNARARPCRFGAGTWELSVT